MGIEEALRSKAREIGLLACGFAHAGPLLEEGEILRRWVAAGRHAEMGYMARSVEARTEASSKAFFRGAKTVIMVAAGYLHPPPRTGSLASAISRYARGRDYHEVMRSKLEALAGVLREATWKRPKIMIFVDTSPIMEKAWARRCGLGWIGRNGLLVSKEMGSWTVLGGIVTDLELSPERPSEFGCGDCRLCVEACPASAILEGGLVDARLCISYATQRKEVGKGDELRLLCGRSIFGCDICQEVCPLNKGAPPGLEEMRPLSRLEGLTPIEVLTLKSDELNLLLDGTTMRSLGAARFIQNIRCFLSGSVT